MTVVTKQKKILSDFVNIGLKNKAESELLTRA